MDGRLNSRTCGLTYLGLIQVIVQTQTSGAVHGRIDGRSVTLLTDLQFDARTEAGARLGRRARTFNGSRCPNAGAEARHAGSHSRSVNDR